MSCLPAPGFCLCHLLSSADFFLPAMPPVAPAARTLGPRAVRFAVIFVAIRHRPSRPHPEPLAGRKRSATSQSPGRFQLVAPPAIPEPGSAASALEHPFRSPAHPGLRQRCYTNSGRLSSRQSRLATSHHYPWQAPRGDVMPGFAPAKPGTGQTARAIIAPASCRHDNCSAHCLIIVRLSDLASRLLPQARPLRGFTSPLSGLCLPGTRQVRLYITKRYANLPGVMMSRTPLTRLPP